MNTVKEIKKEWPGIVTDDKGKHFWLDDDLDDIFAWDVPWDDDRWEDYLPEEGMRFIKDLIRYKISSHSSTEEQ